MRLNLISTIIFTSVTFLSVPLAHAEGKCATQYNYSTSEEELSYHQRGSQGGLVKDDGDGTFVRYDAKQKKYFYGTYTYVNCDGKQDDYDNLIYPRPSIPFCHTSFLGPLGAPRRTNYAWLVGCEKIPDAGLPMVLRTMRQQQEAAPAPVNPRALEDKCWADFNSCTGHPSSNDPFGNGYGYQNCVSAHEQCMGRRAL